MKVSRQTIAISYRETQARNDEAVKKLASEYRIEFPEFKEFTGWKSSAYALYSRLKRESERTMKLVRMYYKYLYMKTLLWEEKQKGGSR